MNRRLVLGFLGVTLFVLLALEVPLGVQNQRSERRDLVAKVEHDALTLASLAEGAVSGAAPGQLRGVAREADGYAAATGGRVVVVARTGRALVDTNPRGGRAETFASRPEIRAALGGRAASGTRPSRTLGTHLLYVAVPVASGGVVHGAVRVTYPMSAVDARVRRYWLLLAAIAASVLGAAATVGVVIARFLTRPLRHLERSAAAVGRGALDARAPEDEGPGELRSLARVHNQMVATLARLLLSQQEFVADASHELRTPLTALQLRLESLERHLAHDGRADLEATLREVGRLSELVESLLALARADAGAAPAGRIDAAAVARERVAFWSGVADRRTVRLVFDAAGPAPARSAAARLAQVLDNLLANALRHAPQATTVTVSVLAGERDVVLRVRDEGPGMTAEQRARAFDRFWRAGSGAGGSGLGLSIVRKLVEADLGRVALEASPAGGIDAVVRLHRV